MTFLKVLSLRTLLQIGNDISDLISVKLDQFKKSQKFHFLVCLCVKLNSRALGVQIEGPITFSRR